MNSTMHSSHSTKYNQVIIVIYVFIFNFDCQNKLQNGLVFKILQNMYLPRYNKNVFIPFCF